MASEAMLQLSGNTAGASAAGGRHIPEMKASSFSDALDRRPVSGRGEHAWAAGRRAVLAHAVGGNGRRAAEEVDAGRTMRGHAGHATGLSRSRRRWDNSRQRVSKRSSSSSRALALPSR